MRWTKLHELKALLVYKKLKEEVEKDNIFPKDKFSSLMRKLENIKYLDTNGKKGLANASKLNKNIFEKYKNKTIQELEQIINKNKLSF